MPTRRCDTTISRSMIGYTDENGPGSCYCYVSQFHNAINQVRDIAWDRCRWFVAPKPGARFKPVGESEVPEEVKKRFNEFLLMIQKTAQEIDDRMYTLQKEINKCPMSESNVASSYWTKNVQIGGKKSISPT